MSTLEQQRHKSCIEALDMLQAAFGGGYYPVVMEPIFEENQLAYVRFTICLPENWQGNADECMYNFDRAWCVPYGHTLPGIVFDYIEA